MKYRRVGTTGLKVSEIAYGSWMTFANQVELDSARAIIQKAFELGINHFDTADIYANGEAETLLGQILPEYDRATYVLATKCFGPMSDHESNKGLSRKHLIDSIHKSLERLNLDYIDLLYCHRYDEETPLEETLRAMNDIVTGGLTTYWGVSEWSAAQIDEAVTVCEKHGWAKPVVDQPLYNLIARDIEKEVIPVVDKHGMGIANYCPLAQGVLTGKYSGGKIPEGSRGSNNAINTFMNNELGNMELLNRIDSLGEIAKKYDLTIAQLSIAWILQNQSISCVLSGASSVEQLESNAKASGVDLKAEDMAAIEVLFPAPE
ncbi:MAG: aldo/keto reductase family protein [Verrucomicrobia bacterium]|nr:aldo/keto reductase family protein [Verrucomicrobiota bacterium]